MTMLEKMLYLGLALPWLLGQPASKRIFPLQIAAAPPEVRAHQIPDSAAGQVLRHWLDAHNSGTAESLRVFVENHYAANLLRHVDIAKHVAFYRDAVRMFGRLERQPHLITKSEPSHLTVELLNADLHGPEKLSPENIVIVEIDMDGEQPDKLARGLGLGSLLCATHK